MTTTTTTTRTGSTNGSRPGTAAGAATATPTTSTTQRLVARNRGRALLGVFLVASFGLLGAMVVESASDRRGAVAVARRVSAGHLIEREDLGQVMVAVDGRDAVIDATEVDGLVGQVALVDLVPGSLLSPGQLGGSRPARRGQAVVGATLKEGQFPIDLQVGSPVSVVILPEQPEAGAPPARPVSGTVVALGRSANGGSTPVSLSVPPEAAAELAVAGAQGRVALVELAR